MVQAQPQARPHRARTPRHRWLRLALITALGTWTSLAAAQSTAPAAPTAPSPAAPTAPTALTGTLVGTVLLLDASPSPSSSPSSPSPSPSSPSSRPLPNAVVVVEGAAAASFRATTDALGQFRLGALPPGVYSVLALGENGEQAAATVTITAGATITTALTLTAEQAPAGGETIVIRGVTAAQERQQSADAVTVVETKIAKREAVDLGEVLARTQGVAVRRDGGLGSSTRLSLAGLSGDQIRFFLDGLPLDLSGYPFGIANVPVNLVERIEVYSGVVPIRFGADALGGGVNLVTQQGASGSHGAVSYELGSFGTHRLAVSASHRHQPTGLYVRADGFFDRARNDYAVLVDVAEDGTGREIQATLDRFHDGYLAGGGVLEVGVTDEPWAGRLALRLFGSGFDKDIQSDLPMERVYGGITYGERTAGASARYEQPLGRGVSLEAVAGYTFTRGDYRDVDPCAYDWRGRCVLAGQPGEIDNLPHEQVSWEHAVFGRANLAWQLHPHHVVRLSIAPTYVTRSGDERLDTVAGGRDPLSAERTLTTVVGGVEHQADLLGDRLQNSLFLKLYVQRQRSEDPQLGDVEFLRTDRSSRRIGIGDGVRLRLADWLYAKASYEWATRLPRPEEVFGDNVFIAANSALAPERSHNVNLGATLDDLATPAGAFTATATGFLREASQLIDLFTSNSDLSYQNLFGARSLGIEASGRWISPGAYVSVEGNTSYQSFRNTSSEGGYGAFEGDRLPNRPFFFAGGAARLSLRDRFLEGDEIVAGLTTRYVHQFFRSWESAGLPSSKQYVPTQLVHSLNVGYVLRTDCYRLTTTIEAANLTDELVYDNYGAQRPGRAFYAKTTIEL